MSDDTPTQRFDGPLDGGDAPTAKLPTPGTDAPTEVFGQPPVPPVGGDGTPPTEGEDAKKSKRTIIILASIGGALLLALIIILIVLLTRGGAEPAPTPSPTASSPSPAPTPTETSPSPTPTPTPTETVTPPPPPPASLITSYTASTTSVDCTGVDSVPVTFSWAATGDTLWFGVGTDNAKDEPYDTFPLNYTMDFDYQCGQAASEQEYTITVQSGSDIESKTIIISE